MNKVSDVNGKKQIGSASKFDDAKIGKPVSVIQIALVIFIINKIIFKCFLEQIKARSPTLFQQSIP